MARWAFRILKILAALAVLGIGAGLLFPMTSTDCGGGRIAQAKNEAIQLAAAVNAYVLEYGRLPTDVKSDATFSEGPAASQLMDVLAATPRTPGAMKKNPRKFVFLEIPRARNGRNGRVDDSGPYLDPWGNAYFFTLDADSNGSVVAPDGSTVQKTVLVWSRGNPEKKDRFNDPKRWIKSWE